MMVEARCMMTHLVFSRNGEGRLRRSLDASALDFILQSFQFVGATTFALYSIWVSP
jgi:hypothetical protein